MELMKILFFRCKAEYDGYEGMANDGTYSAEEMEKQKERLMSVYQVIEEANLKKEYKLWEESCNEGFCIGLGT